MAVGARRWGAWEIIEKFRGPGRVRGKPPRTGPSSFYQSRRTAQDKNQTMTTPLSTTPGADLPSPFGWGRGSLNDSFWYTGWLLPFLAAGDQTQGRFALIDALARKDNCPPRHIHQRGRELLHP